MASVLKVLCWPESQVSYWESLHFAVLGLKTPILLEKFVMWYWCSYLASFHLLCCCNCRKGKDVTPSFKHFFSSAMSLSSINVSGTKLPPEALKWETQSFTFNVLLLSYILCDSTLCPLSLASSFTYSRFILKLCIFRYSHKNNSPREELH